MQFEIYRCATMFCWRLLGADGSLIADGAKPRRHRDQIDQDVLSMMDQVPNATIHDKTSANTVVKVKASKTNGKHHGVHL